MRRLFGTYVRTKVHSPCHLGVESDRSSYLMVSYEIAIDTD
jgi:hypothetical protein